MKLNNQLHLIRILIFFGGVKNENEPGIVAHTCNSSTCIVISRSQPGLQARPNLKNKECKGAGGGTQHNSKNFP